LENDALLRREGIWLGEGTVNVAEYAGLLAGLRAAIDLGVDDLEVTGDSALVVHQVRGAWKIKAQHLRPLVDQARQMLTQINTWKIYHIPRSENQEADALYNETLDSLA
jgi:ribonuclease HI